MLFIAGIEDVNDLVGRDNANRVDLNRNFPDNRHSLHVSIYIQVILIISYEQVKITHRMLFMYLNPLIYKIYTFLWIWVLALIIFLFADTYCATIFR